MSDYMTLTKADAQNLFDQFPSIDADALTKEVNQLFTPYLFFHRERNSISLSCSLCQTSGSMDKLPRTIGPVERAIVYGKHNETATCPYCGKPVTLKNVSRLGAKKNILEYQPVIFLSAKDGDLYARCYWARKDYQGELTESPLFMDTYAMHFSIGRSEEVCFEQTGYNKFGLKHYILEGNYDPVHRVIVEPFSEGGWFSSIRYIPYHVYGLEEIAKSDFRYCQYEEFIGKKAHESKNNLHSDMCKYLAAYSIYPRQIEMLMKTGGKPLVEDLVIGRRKNSKIIKWKATNPFDAFGLDKVELREFRESECSIRIIEQYKLLRRHNLTTNFKTLRAFERSTDADEVAKVCVKRNLHPDKLFRYLNRFTGPRCGGMGVYTEGCAFRDWLDYTVMAEKLGYDLEVETVLMPRSLDQAHQNALEEMLLRKNREEREKEQALIEQAKEYLSRRQKKYNIELEGYFIRIAVSPNEITTEGKALSHCVGEYAERHMNGSTTILFLRRCDEPGKSLYTIQMDGDTLVQIHGYKNELDRGKRIAPDPRETMRWLLDPWLKWVKKGSPRREDGTPRLPKFKEVKTA